jgi:hypothetical protein
MKDGGESKNQITAANLMEGVDAKKAERERKRVFMGNIGGDSKRSKLAGRFGIQ